MNEKKFEIKNQGIKINPSRYPLNLPKTERVKQALKNIELNPHLSEHRNQSEYSSACIEDF
jgi:hypothetical protein